MARPDWDGDELTEREAYYSELLDEQEESGLSVAAFAEYRGLAAATLYSWRRRLGRASSRSRGTALVEVCVHDDDLDEGAAGRMTVVTSSGARVEVDADFDESALARLLGVLEGC